MATARGSTAGGLLASCLFLAMSGDVGAQPDGRGELAARCVAAARSAEAAAGLPEGLLVAVAVVESALHPYAVGSEREGRYAASALQAKEAAREMAAAARSVAGGCFQVNIGVHARGGAAWVFDPAASAAFAAGLLNDLRSRHGSWAAALAAYHGAAGATGRAYACRVRAALAEIAPASAAAVQLTGCPAAAARAMRAKAAALLAHAGVAEELLAEAPGR